MISFALTDYDLTKPINTLDDLSYGALKAYYMQWDPDVELEYFKPVPASYCTPE